MNSASGMLLAYRNGQNMDGIVMPCIRMAAATARTLTARVGLGISLILSCFLLMPFSAWAEAVHTFNFSGTGATDMGTYKQARYWWFKVSQNTLTGYSFGDRKSVV